ncbi:tyrosine-type recombinase/integrase [Acidiphilium multivorum]|uniref:tyrosine-type recombinase/integrase n=2 Tax=Acidiphilium TaxID=522 RepID=UPI001F4C1C9B|nr:tyrosine-type recombinase/integrase [Acidiphilium multivorum]
MTDVADGRGRERVVVSTYDGELYMPLLEFFRDENLAVPTERDYAQVVTRLYEFLDAVATNDPPASEAEAKTVLNRFATAISSGTINKFGDDPLNLYWTGMGGKRSANLLTKLFKFADWLEHQGFGLLHGLTVPANLTDRVCYVRAFNKRKAASLLGHLKRMQEMPERVGLHKRARRREPIVMDDLHAFPEEILPRLLTQGFARGGAATATKIELRYDIQSILMVLIMHFGGLRISEVCHLWTPDIRVGERGCQIDLFHPSDGKIVWRGKAIRRAEYLMLHGMRPLTESHGNNRVGWKGSLITNGRMMSSRIFLVPPEISEQIRILYQLHVATRPSSENGHPWLFVKDNGRPMTPKAFKEHHERALRRIGYEPNSIDGLDMHGHRHSYGHRIGRIFEKKDIMVMMRHTSPFSQEAYKQMSENGWVKRIDEALRDSVFNAPLLPLFDSGG